MKKEKKEEESQDIIVQEVPDDGYLPRKSLFRTDEVCAFFDVTDRCTRLWVQHGHLEKKKGSNMITRESILRCKFNKFVAGPEL